MFKSNSKILNGLVSASVLAATFFISAPGRADAPSSDSDQDCGKSFCFVGDYNVGGGAMFEIGTESSASGAGGLFSNAEAVFLERSRYEKYPDGDDNRDQWYLQDITFLDGRLMSFIGAGVAPGMGGQVSVQFRLKMLGSIGGGLMLYQLLPVSLALEDASLEISEGEVSGAGLLGSTVVIPVSLLAGMDSFNLYVSMTAGVRFSTELSDPAFALQPKVRFISDKVSLEARGLFTVGSPQVEQKAALVAAVNHVFGKGDQLGLLVGATRLAQPGQEARRVMEVLFFYGRNL